ncbi:carbohydrate kinase family protein [Spirillospora sp. CA-108201]
MARFRSPLEWPGLHGAAERRFTLFVVGDAGVEVRASLPDVRFAELGADRLCYAPAQVMTAGTAVNLARCAAGYFRRIGVLAKVGDDDYTEAIRRELRRIGAAHRLVVEPGVPNGVSVMLRDGARGADGSGPGVRLLVVQDEPPARRLTAADVRTAADGIEEADVLAVDGYSLLAPDSREALHEAVRTARAAGTRVAFDVVPHDIDARLPASCVLPVLERADLVVSEAHTLARLLGRPPPGGGEPRDLLPVLDRAVTGGPLWLLRFGPTFLERVLAHQRGRSPVTYSTGYTPDMPRAGYGDRLASCELYWWLSGG